MGRTVIVVEKRDGIVTSLLKVTGKFFYFVYIFPFVWLYGRFVKKPAPPAQLAPSVVVNVAAPQAAPAQVVVREVVKVRCGHCGALADQGVAKCPECAAPVR